LLKLFYFCRNTHLNEKITLLFVLFLIVSACGVRQTRNYLTSGEYNAAINSAVEGLRSNKNAKSKQDYVYLLEEAFAKAKERDLRDINAWLKEANPNNFEKYILHMFSWIRVKNKYVHFYH